MSVIEVDNKWLFFSYPVNQINHKNHARAKHKRSVLTFSINRCTYREGKMLTKTILRKRFQSLETSIL